MAYMRLFLQDAHGEFPCCGGVIFDAMPQAGAIVRAPGRPSLLVKAVRPALPAREDDEDGIPACIFAVVLNDSTAPMPGFELPIPTSNTEPSIQLVAA